MKLTGLVLLAFFALSVVDVAHSAIFDTILDTMKEVGSGLQKAGDDILGAFMLPTRKCKNGPCSTADKVKIMEEHNIGPQNFQPAYTCEY